MNPPHTSAREAAEQYADEVAANTFDDSYTGSEIRAYYKFMTSAFEAGYRLAVEHAADAAKAHGNGWHDDWGGACEVIEERIRALLDEKEGT